MGQAMFRTPFIVPSLTRVICAGPKKGCWVTWGYWKTFLLLIGQKNNAHLSPGCLHASSVLQLPIVNSTSCFALPPSLQDLENICTKITWVWIDLRWGNLYWDNPTLSDYGVKVKVPGIGWNIMAGNSCSCSGWPGLLSCSDVPYALNSALIGLPSWPLNLLLISSAHSAEYNLCMIEWASP